MSGPLVTAMFMGVLDLMTATLLVVAARRLTTLDLVASVQLIFGYLLLLVALVLYIHLAAVIPVSLAVSSAEGRVAASALWMAHEGEEEGGRRAGSRRLPRACCGLPGVRYRCRLLLRVADGNSVRFLPSTGCSAAALHGMCGPVRPAPLNSTVRKLAVGSSVDAPGLTEVYRAVRPHVIFQHDRQLVKQRYLITRVSELGVLGLYGKLIQWFIQPMNN
uniref:Uncharacterized protein n=1 Tax=Leersia perrieri TaxID=77586 RepID=A0A0D9XB76_9ORYZ